MPVLRRAARGERSPVRTGVVAVVVLALLVGLALNSGSIYRALAASHYSAVFAEAGGLRAGDEVRLGGFAVGKVTSLRLEDGRVVVEFSVEGGGPLGEATEAVVKTATPLGTKFLSVVPAGPGRLESGARIPIERTRSPYDVQDILENLGSVTADVDLPQLAHSLDVVAETFRDTPDELGSAVAGLSRLSRTIASRDVALRELLSDADGVTGMLAERSDQLATLIGDANALLDELYRRRAAIRSLLDGITAVLTQLSGAVADNEAQIGPAMRELERVLDLLNRNNANIAAAIEGLRTYAGSLGEAVASGPWFYALVPNLPPTNMVQQDLPSVIDAATPANPSIDEPRPKEGPR